MQGTRSIYKNQLFFIYFLFSFKLSFFYSVCPPSLFFSLPFICFFVFCFVLAALGLLCCAWAFSSCGERGLLCCSAWTSHCSGFSCCGAWVLGAQASVVTARRLSSCNAWALGTWASVVVACRLSSCGAWA